MMCVDREQKIQKRKESQRAMEPTPGTMDKPTRENGLMGRKMGQGSGEVPTAILILGNGRMDKRMAMEYTLLQMEIDMRENSLIVSNMEKESKSLLMAILIKVYMRMENQKATENIIGQWAVFSKGTLKMDSEMEMECGREELATATNMRESINRIKSKGMEFLFGKMETFTRETLLMI